MQSFNPFNPSVTHDFNSNSVPMTDQPDARTRPQATQSDSPQDHKSAMQKIKEMIPGTKAHKAKKAQKAGVQEEMGTPQGEAAPNEQPFEETQMQQPRGSLGGTSNPAAREQMSAPMGTDQVAGSAMGPSSMEADSLGESSEARPFFQYVQQQWQQMDNSQMDNSQMDNSLGEGSDSRVFFQYVQQQMQRMEILAKESDQSKNPDQSDLLREDAIMGTSMMSPSLEKDPMAEQNAYGNIEQPIGVDDLRHLRGSGPLGTHAHTGTTVHTRESGLQHGGTHAQTGTLHRPSERLPSPEPLTDKESGKADYTGTNDTGSGLQTTRRGVEQV